MIILVTGATAGFGAAISRRFVAEGHRVVAAGRRAERLYDQPTVVHTRETSRGRLKEEAIALRPASTTSSQPSASVEPGS